MRSWWVCVVLLLVGGGCLQSGSITCKSGRVCPANTTCRELPSTGGETCAEAADVTACADAADGAPCSSNGNCHDGVCLHACGDGVRTGAEQCDGTDLGSAADCSDLGYYESSPLVCSPSCTYDLIGDFSAGCTGYCGDDLVNGPELCEDKAGWTDVRTCLDFGLDAGAMSCARCGPSFDGCKEIGFKPALIAAGSIHGRARDDAWIVSGDHALHYDGKDWTSVALPGTSTTGAYHTVWVETSGRAWVGGTAGDQSLGAVSGLIASWNGTTWTSIPVTGGGGIAGIWAAGDGDAWAAGTAGAPGSETGAIVHAHAGSAAAVTIPSVPGLDAIWGSAANDIWAVGQAGTILHYTGSAWTTTTSPASADLVAIYGASATDVWAVGGSEIIHFDGSQWRSVVAPASAQYLSSVWVTGSHVWIGGSQCLFEYDGTYWMSLPAAFGVLTEGLWGSGPGDVWAAVARNDGLAVVNHFSGSAWARSHFLDNAGVQSLFDDGKTIWASMCGSGGGSLWRYVDGAWAQQAPTSVFCRLPVWGAGPDDMWAIIADTPGGPSTPSGEFEHFDGNAWTSITTIDFPTLPPTAVWGSSASDVWAVGAASGIWRSTGSTWMLVDSTQGLSSLSGTGPSDVWAAGNGGLVMHYDGIAWSQSRAATGDSIAAIWAAGPNDVWAAGNAIFHYDGTSWTTSLPWPSAYYGIGGTGPKDVFAVGGGSHVMHWDGAAWNPVRAAYDDPGSPTALYATAHAILAGLGDGTVVGLLRDVAW